MHIRSSRRTATDYFQAVEDLHRAGLTDGLPVIPPTPQLVEEMIGWSGKDGDVIVAEVAPSFGEATIEKIAINAVMAGCLPEHLPVVIAAVEAVCDERFDLGEVQATTHPLGPTLIVNGPAREACGPIASGFGCLGPGHRANMSIGRALRLILRNIGGGVPGVSDMALFGQPGKLWQCFAENEEESPFPPLHVSLGFKAGQSVVTVLGTDGARTVLAMLDADDATAPDRFLNQIARTVAAEGTNNTLFGNGHIILALNPDHAKILAKAGYGRERIQEEIHKRAKHSIAYLKSFAPEIVITRNTGDLTTLRAPDRLLVCVAGGSGAYSVVFPSWGAGAHKNMAISREIALDAYCEIPGATPSP